MIITASKLFKNDSGPQKCYYCGADCGVQNKKSDFVKDTFTNRDIVMFPGSEFVCNGCVESMGRGSDEMEMIDGSIKKRDNECGMQPRLYSWVLCKNKKMAATKAHLSQLLEAVLNPPEPPFAIVLADSGQKQLIFRAPVGIDKEKYSLLLEDEKIFVDTKELKVILPLVNDMMSIFGKKRIFETESTNAYRMFIEKFGIEQINKLELWNGIKKMPLAKLAVWLTKSTKDKE
jgi:CRISPR type IV-associated protein Csf1